MPGSPVCPGVVWAQARRPVSFSPTDLSQGYISPSAMFFFLFLECSYNIEPQRSTAKNLVSLLWQFWQCVHSLLQRCPKTCIKRDHFFSFPLPTPRSLWDLSSLIRDWTRPSAVKVLSANHWTAREFLKRDHFCKDTRMLACTYTHSPTNRFSLHINKKDRRSDSC